VGGKVAISLGGQIRKRKNNPADSNQPDHPKPRVNERPPQTGKRANQSPLRCPRKSAKLMMQQITELTAVQNQNAERNSIADLQMGYEQQRDKRDTPTTLTEMTNSPTQIQKTQKTDIAPQNLLDTLSKPMHRTPTRSCSLAAISETAQGKTRNSPGRKHISTTTSYANGMTGGSQK
jgi:hypothetical protein